MSYSTCLRCGQPVGCYEKYCRACQQKHSLPEEPDFWRGRRYPTPEERAAIVAADMAAAKGEHDA